MKKTLLFFLLLFTTIFHAQVSNIEHCAGNNTFDLTSQKPLLIGNLNPAETTVSYHISLADANNNLNAIADPANFVDTGNVPTIYARIDNNGIITTNYFNLIVNPVLVANASVVYVNCVPRIVISGSGGNSNYEYSHAGVTFTQNNIVNNPSPGNQTVYVRDGNGCVASKSLIVESLSPLTWRAKRTNVTCQGANDGTLEITASGGKSPYSFSLGNENGFTTSNIFSNLSVGTYTIYIKDVTGCMISLLMDVYQTNPSIVIAETITNDSNNTNEGKIALNVSGGVYPYNYSLKDGKGIIIPSKTTNPFTGLAAGSYEVFITDSQGCTSSKAVNILNAPTPLTTTSTVTPITCVITTGTITITPNGGALPYQYSIDNGKTYGNSNVFSGLVAGNYDIKVLDAQNSVVSATSIIDPIKMPEITITYKDVLCHGNYNGSILVGASNGKSPNLFSINGGEYTSNNLFENLSAGNYVLSVKDSNGCIVSGSVTLKDPALITAEIVISDKSVVVNASGGYGKYEYSLDGGTYKDPNTFSNVSYGDHVISVRDPNKCMLTLPISVVKPIPVLSSVVVDKGTLTITASGGTLPYTYSLQDISGYPTYKTQADNIFTDVVNGTYKTIVTDSKGVTYVQADIVVSGSSVLTAIATATSITCRDLKGIITVTATGGKSPYQYSLDYGNTYTSSNVLPNLNVGGYTITVKDSNNFKTTTWVNITQAKSAVITSEIVSEISCNGAKDGVIKINVVEGQSPYTYSIDNGNFQLTETFRDLSPGNHTIRVLDGNSCEVTMSVKLSEPVAIVSTVVVNDKTISASSTGGTPPYSYILQNNNAIVTGPQPSNTFENLPLGVYSLQTIDKKGCTTIQTGLTVRDSPLLSATIMITPIICDNPKASITVHATGGSGSYEYSLNNITNYSPASVFSGLSPGTYTINVRDGQNTVISFTATISPLNSLDATAFLVKPIDCISNATINVSASGGKVPYQYSLDGITYTSNNVFTNINAGNYTIRVKDSLGCTAITNNIILEQPIPLTATVHYTKINDCSSLPITDIVVNAVGGQAPYQYSIDNLPYQTNYYYSGAFPGNYVLNVKDASGCIYNTVFTIESPVSLTATATVTNAISCGDNDTVTITATGGQEPYTYSFDGLNTFSPINTSGNLTTGTHLLFAKDSNGCKTSFYITLLPHDALVSRILTLTNTTSANNDGSITMITDGGTAPYSYSLLNSSNTIIIPAQNSSTFNNLAAGTYGVIVKDSKGCISTLTQVTISAPSTTFSAVITVTQPSCDNPSAIINIIATGGSPGYLYSIDNGKNFVSANVFIVTQPGNYLITVRDAENAIYTYNVVIMPLDPLLVNVTVISNVTCLSNGMITAHVTGGRAPYSYSLNGAGFQDNNTFSNLLPGIYSIAARDTNGCIQILSIELSSPTPIVATVTTDNQNIIVKATGGTDVYQYSLDGINFQPSNIFTMVNYGTYQIVVKDQNGCLFTTIATLDTPAPLIDGKKVITIEFKAGQTLGDLVLEGQNIQWYSNPKTSSAKTKKASEATLPLTTVLVDGTTYYASQTINGIESTERLAVTAKLDGSLSAPDFALSNFRFYPNPVQHSLTIDNTATIDEIEILSVSGKSILAKKINNTHSEIDLSNVATGFYFLRVKAEGKTKTIKIVKK